MPDIFHAFPINARPEKVFQVISTSEGLDNWWTKSSEAKPGMDAEYKLYFGPEYDWKALVTKYQPNEAFELQMTDAMPDWLGTKVGFTMQASKDGTQVEFYHTGWPENSEHYRISCFCWAMYLRILKRYTEFGEQVPYEQRLDV